VEASFPTLKGSDVDLLPSWRSSENISETGELSTEGEIRRGLLIGVRN
jgi:hypothetical protein